MLALGQPQPLQPAPRPDQPAAEALASSSAVAASWYQWIAECLLRNCTVESMLQTMVAAGIPRDVAATAVQEMHSDPVFAAAMRMRELRDKQVSVMQNLQRLWEQAPHYDHVEKRSRVSKDEFLTRYVYSCRPVVLRDLTTDWPAMQRWSPEDLKARFGHLEVEIQAERSGNRLYEMDKLKHKRQVNLGNFVDRVTSTGVSNDEYLTANNELLRRPEFAPLLEDIGSLPDICDRSRLAESSSFWFGPAGTVTPLHHDTLMLFHTQVVGRKRWRFVSPLENHRVYNNFDVYSPVDLDAVDLHRYPEFANVKVLDVVVEPGETMFLPLAWWHQVSSLDVSLSFSYSNLSVPNEYSFVNPKITNW